MQQLQGIKRWHLPGNIVTLFIIVDTYLYVEIHISKIYFSSSIFGYLPVSNTKLAGAYALSGKINFPEMILIGFPITSPRRFTGVAST